jgi:nucleotide-binding universal stress UspA family protein
MGPRRICTADWGIAATGLAPARRDRVGKAADSLAAHDGIRVARPEAHDDIKGAAMKLGKVLVPLDGSPTSEAIFPFLLLIAGPLDLQVVLLRVVEPMPPQAIEGMPHMTLEDVEARRVDAEEYLAPLAVELRAKGVRVECRVRRGDPVTEIVAAAREARVDMIAMSTHGRGGLGRLLFGSVAEAVLRKAELPVYLLRATDAEVAARSAASGGR